MALHFQACFLVARLLVSQFRAYFVVVGLLRIAPVVSAAPSGEASTCPASGCHVGSSALDIPNLLRPARDIAAPMLPTRGMAGPLRYMQSLEEYEARTRQQVNGELYDLPLPKLPEDLISDMFGPPWLTEAFHRVGSLPKDNQIVNASLKRFTERPGGSGPKALLDVEYAHPDPDLETRLFVKMPYTLDEDRKQRIMEGGQMSTGDVWGGEVHFYRFVSPYMPFPVPKFYFGDFSRYSSDAVIIISAVPFPDTQNTSTEGFAPFQILPTTGKAEDFKYSNVHKYYFALSRRLGTMAGNDKLGKLGPYQNECKKMAPVGLHLGPAPDADPQFTGYDSSKYKQRTPYDSDPPCLWWSWYGPHLGEYGQGYAPEAMAPNHIAFIMRHFIENVAPHIFPEGMKEKAWLDKFVRQITVITRFQHNINRFAYSDFRYVALLNMNANSDNAFFWKGEDGMIEAGLLDWASTGKMSFSQAFHGMFTSSLGEMVADYEDRFVDSFAEAYHATGAPEIDVEEFRLRLRVSTCNAVIGMLGMVNIWMNGRENDWMSGKLQSYNDSILKQEYSFNDKFLTSMFYQHAVLWWKRGDVYYDAFLEWAKRDLKPPWWQFWYFDAIRQWGVFNLLLNWRHLLLPIFR